MEGYPTTANFPGNAPNLTVTVPFRKRWHVTGIHVTYTSTATVGNRWLRVLYQTDAPANIMQIEGAGYQAASLTRQYIMQPMLPDAIPLLSVFTIPILDAYLYDGYHIVILDANGIDNSDTMNVHIHYIEETI